MALDTKQLKRAIVQTDNVGEEHTFDDTIEAYKTFSILSNIISILLNAKEMEVETFEKLLDIILDGLDEDEREKIAFIGEQLLTYIKVPESAIDDLLSDDSDIAQDEFESLVETLIDRIGDGDINEFIATALHNEMLDTIDLDSIQYDWVFYKSKPKCKKGRAGNEYNESTQQCKIGYSDGVKGFWRYPSGDFPNGNYNHSKNKDKKRTAEQNAQTLQAQVKAHTGEADTKRRKNILKRYGSSKAQAKASAYGD
jgi:hypothetical protein